MQVQAWNKARPELIELFLKPLHALTERYDGKVLLGEISGDDALLRAAEYTNGGGLDIAYSFDLLSCPGTPREIRGIVERLERNLADGWACWSFSNHDVRRVTSRWGGDDPPEGLRQLVPVLLCSLRGTLCLYQGEELGLEEAELEYEQIRDPYGLAFWPSFKGRDGCRTPHAVGEIRPRGRLHHRPALAAGAREPSPPCGRPAASRPGLGAQHHPRLPQLAPRAPAAQDRPDQVPAHHRRPAGLRAQQQRPAAVPVQPGRHHPALPGVGARPGCRLHQRRRRSSPAAASSCRPGASPSPTSNRDELDGRGHHAQGHQVVRAGPRHQGRRPRRSSPTSSWSSSAPRAAASPRSCA